MPVISNRVGATKVDAVKSWKLIGCAVVTTMVNVVNFSATIPVCSNTDVRWVSKLIYYLKMWSEAGLDGSSQLV